MKRTDGLREQIYHISLTPINDIYYVPPGVSGSMGLSEERIDKIIQLFEAEVAQRCAEAYQQGYDDCIKEQGGVFKKGRALASPTAEQEKK